PLHDFLWSEFWTGLLPLLAFPETLTIAANAFMSIDPMLKWVAAAGVFCMAFATVGLAVGLGARYPRFGADPNQVAGSYGGVMFMIVGLLYIVVMIALLGWPSSVWLISGVRGIRLSLARELLMAASVATAVILSVVTWIMAMRSGVAALEGMKD